jgi:ABC-2 type transport system permease protein
MTFPSTEMTMTEDAMTSGGNSRARVGFFYASWLLLRLQLLRFGRQLTAGLPFLNKKPAPGKRQATPGKARRGWLVAGLVALSISFTFFNIAQQTMSKIGEQMGTAAATDTVAKPGARRAAVRVPLPPAPGFALAPNVLKAVTAVMLLLLLASMLLAIGNGELTRPDWDLEWLATLPLPITTLLASRIASRAVISPMGLAALWPFLLTVAWYAGYRWAAPVMGLVAALPLLLIAAAVQTVCDTGLRLRLGPSQLRNLQAAVALLAVGALYLAMSPAMPATTSFVLGWAHDLPYWMFWLPPGLAVQMLTANTPLASAGAFALLTAEALLFTIAAVFLVKHELRAGIVAAGARESGRTDRAARKVAHGERKRADARWLLTPIQARELRLLGRDRNFLVQTLVMPVVLIGAQVVFNSGHQALLASAYESPAFIATVAFGIASYALMFSAFQTLNTEGHALWILYSVPHSLESVLRHKAALWGGLCFVYPLAIFSAVMAVGGAPSWDFIVAAALVFLGIPIFAIIATALGVFACDPLAPQVQRRVRVSYVYLYLLLTSTYLYSLYASSFSRRLPLLILTALLAFALWQKARDQMPFLLDPTESPPVRVSISDGLIAALMFFVLQGIVMAIFAFQAFEGEGELTGFHLLIAFVSAGAVTFAVMRLAFWRLKSEGVPRTFGSGALKTVCLGVAGGIAAAAIAFVYLKFAMHSPLFQEARPMLLRGEHAAALFALLAICAAPVFEEFIFRGLIFGGLRRSMGLTASVLASAAIFAIVHPPISIIPVFVLGVITAMIYGRDRLLIGPIAAHAAYNAIIIGFQPLL